MDHLHRIKKTGIKLNQFIKSRHKRYAEAKFEILDKHYKSVGILINKYPHLKSEALLHSHLQATVDLSVIFLEQKLENDNASQKKTREDLYRLILIIESLKRQKSKDVRNDFKSFLQTPAGLSAVVISVLLMIVIILLIVLIFS